jgi:acetolactate synthase-1/2/3 large subunit
MSKGSPISPSLMATKSAGATKAPERADRTAEHAVVAADLAAASPVLGPNNVVPPTVMTGSQAIVRSLEELGVDDIFGLPGGAILPTYDPLMASSRTTSWSVTNRELATPRKATPW